MVVYSTFTLDYVKRLVQPPETDWVASGGLDRQILMWDLVEPRSSAIRTLFKDEHNLSGSIYALGANPSGTVLVCGTPQKFLSILDHRVPLSTVQKLVGHSDAIRDVLISDDGKWV